MSQFPFTGGGKVATDDGGRPLAGSSGLTAVSGVFSATGVSGVFNPISTRDFNISFTGTYVASFQLERSFDYNPLNPGVATWYTAITTTIFATLPPSFTWNESEDPCYYRLRCTAYTSGTANYRISQ